jgi:TetR/AcrR family transcriptional regulator of autoinduction and epiphytic fitness
MIEVKKTRSELKREAILEGAKQAFQQFGIENTSMDRVAELAKVSKRTVYNHFESKEILVTHIIKEVWVKANLGCELEFDPNRDIKPQLMELVFSQLTVFNQTKVLELIRVAVGHCLYNPENFKAEIADFFEQETALIRWIKNAMEQGALRQSDPLVANEQILGLIKGQALWPQLLHAEAVLSEEQNAALAEQTVDMFLSYYGKE